ncbi:MAG TPA: hypothetical protein PJ991_05860 [Kiritimatiellia bacterium]|nr:hypothetical protein [Kiritimatiellia bacterium]
MKTTFQPINQGGFIRAFTALGLLVGLLWASGVRAQTAAEHASHHPEGAAPAAGGMPGATPATDGMPATSAGPAAGGGMMEQMGEMMKGMGGAPPKKELYPELMSLPELTPEKRQEVEQQSDERMHAGAVLMGQALDSLNVGAQSGDYAGMHDATMRLREGLAQIESGIAARRALAEGHAPREVALAWFKREMSLPAGAAAPPHRGVTLFHLFTMVLLVAFALAMVVMYFFKMRRAAALFGRIEDGKGSPPPGSAPPLAGGKPLGGKKTPADDKPVAV